MLILRVLSMCKVKSFIFCLYSIAQGNNMVYNTHTLGGGVVSSGIPQKTPRFANATLPLRELLFWNTLVLFERGM